MGKFSLRYRVETKHLSAPFRISGFVFETSDVVVVELSDGSFTGLGEAAGVYYLGDNSAHIVAELSAHRAIIEDGPDREELRSLMPAGGARNAVDCAMWDLEAKREGTAAHHGLPFHDQGAVVEHQVHVASELRRHPPRGGIAPTRHQHEAHARASRRGEGGDRPRGDRLVAAQERAVDVKREQAVGRPHGPVQISTRSMVSPGRILSTTSMPSATHPKTV